MKNINGTLTTREDNSMSLSCSGLVEIKDGIITNVSFKGYPRTFGDAWTSFYQDNKIGDKITQKQIETILSYNGKYNVVSTFTEK